MEDKNIEATHMGVPEDLELTDMTITEELDVELVLNVSSNDSAPAVVPSDPGVDVGFDSSKTRIVRRPDGVVFTWTKVLANIHPDWEVGYVKQGVVTMLDDIVLREPDKSPVKPIKARKKFPWKRIVKKSEMVEYVKNRWHMDVPGHTMIEIKELCENMEKQESNIAKERLAKANKAAGNNG